MKRYTSATGKPIAGADVRFPADDANRQRFGWSGKTDEDGRLEWLSAPSTEETYVVSASSYQSQENIKLTPNGAEHVVRLHKSAESPSDNQPLVHHPLHPEVHVVGTVVDAESRRPISKFQVLTYDESMSGSQPGSTRQESAGSSGADGKFSFTINGDVRFNVLEIQSDGYWPVRLTNQEPFTAEIRPEVALKPATGVAGFVQLPSGAPAVGAAAILRTSSGSAYMRNPGNIEGKDALDNQTTTDSDGHFAFQPRLDVRALIVAHKAGFAEISSDQFSATNIVMLQPWGRVSGTLKIGRRSGANETMLLHNWFFRGTLPSEMPPFSVMYSVKTDADGHFEMECVPPGDWSISHQLNFKDGKPGIVPVGQDTPIHVLPGQTTQVTIGGVGRRIIGKVDAKDPSLHIDWRRDVQHLISIIPELQEPATPGAISHDELKRQNEFWLSPAGRQAQLDRRLYVPVFESDGSFRVDDVLPGDYDLSITIADPNTPDNSFQNLAHPKIIGTVTKRITVTAAADVESPLDVGVLELNLE
jgi:hypothetical protein